METTAGRGVNKCKWLIRHHCATQRLSSHRRTSLIGLNEHQCRSYSAYKELVQSIAMSGHMFRHRDTRPGEEPEATKKAESGDGGFGAFFSSHTWEGSKDQMRSALARATLASSAATARAREASGSLSERIRAHPTMARLQRHPTLGRFFPAPAVHPEAGELSPVEFLDSPDGSKGSGADGADD